MKYVIYCISLVVSSFVACAGTAPPAQSDAAKHEAADATYFGDMMLCIDKNKYPTLKDSDACTTATRLRWHRLEDGGADGFYADGGK